MGKKFDIKEFYENNKEVQESFSDFYDFLYALEDNYSGKELAEFNLKRLEQDGGGEGGSETCYLIFEYEGTPYQLDYSYYSYNGNEYWTYEAYEVKPVEVTVTQYSRVG